MTTTPARDQTVPPTVGVTLQVDPLAPIVTAVTAANAPAAAAVATIDSTGNSAFQLLLMTDMPAEIVNRGATLMFNGAPLQFASGVAVLNGMMATGAGVREQRGDQPDDRLAVLVAVGDRRVIDFTGLDFAEDSVDRELVSVVMLDGALDLLRTRTEFLALELGDRRLVPAQLAVRADIVEPADERANVGRAALGCE